MSGRRQWLLSARRWPAGSSARHGWSASSSIGTASVSRLSASPLTCATRASATRPPRRCTWSYQQESETREELTFAIRTDAAPQLFIDAVRREVRAASADLPLYNVSTLAARYDGSITSERMLATTSGVLGGLSLLLVVVGVYGTLAYAAAQRTRELGVRLALGAARTDIARLLLRDALVPVAAGVVIGLPVALAAGALARGTLFGVSAADPWTYIASSVVLVAAGTVAAVIPARRAANTDPMTALREDG